MCPEPDAVVVTVLPELRRGVAPPDRSLRRQNDADLVVGRDARHWLAPLFDGIPFFREAVEGQECADQLAGLIGVGEWRGGVPVALERRLVAAAWVHPGNGCLLAIKYCSTGRAPHGGEASVSMATRMGEWLCRRC